MKARTRLKGRTEWEAPAQLQKEPTLTERPSQVSAPMPCEARQQMSGPTCLEARGQLMTPTHLIAPSPMQMPTQLEVPTAQLEAQTQLKA